MYCDCWVQKQNKLIFLLVFDSILLFIIVICIILGDGGNEEDVLNISETSKNVFHIILYHSVDVFITDTTSTDVENDLLSAIKCR